MIAFSVFFGAGSDGEERSAIFVSDTRGRTARQLTPRNGYAKHPAWSPDGRKIAFDNSAGISVMNLDGSHRRLIVPDAYTPRWSPDGTKIVCLTPGAKTVKMLIVDADGRNKRVVAPRVSWIYPALDWSPDGRKIAFVASRGANWTKIYVVKIDGTGLKELGRIPSGVDGDMPRWSPDGKRLLFTRHHDRTTGLYVLKVDDGTVKRLIEVDADAAASWSPDGRRIVYGTTNLQILDLGTLTRTALVPRPCRRFACFDADWRRVSR